MTHIWTCQELVRQVHALDAMSGSLHQPLSLSGTALWIKGQAIPQVQHQFSHGQYFR